MSVENDKKMILHYDEAGWIAAGFGEVHVKAENLRRLCELAAFTVGLKLPHRDDDK